MIDLGYWSFMMEQEKKNKRESRGNRIYNAQNDFMLLCMHANPGSDVTDLFHKALDRNDVRESELLPSDCEQFQKIADRYFVGY